MIELKKEFETKKYGFHHHQVFKDGELVIYEISKDNADGDGKTVWYEVFKYRTLPPDQYHQDEYEQYPKADEYFGNWAWSCSNENIVNKVLKREFPNHPMTKEEFRSQMSY